MKKHSVKGLFLLAALLFIAACGAGGVFSNDQSGTVATGTGTGTGTGTAVSVKATLSGSASGTLTKPTSKPDSSGTGTFHSPMAGGTIKVINSKGVVIGTGTIAADGSYTVAVDKGSNYIIKAVNGNVCLKSIVEVADGDKTVTVDPTSSAIVKVLSKKLGKDKLGDEGEDVSSVVGSTDVSAIVVAIKNSGTLKTIAEAIQNDIAANADYSSTTVTVGVVSTAGNGDANTLAITITITITIVVNGQAVTAPGAPTGVTATAGDGQAAVNWTAVTGATSYNLYYSTTSGVAGIKINGITTGTSYTLTGLTNGVKYYLTVTASKSGTESVGSAQISATPLATAPGAPTGVNAAAGSGQVTISWTGAKGATSYNVYYRTTSGVTIANGTKVTGVASGGTITGLANGTTYYFIVTAVNVSGEIASNEITATPQVLAPAAPTGFSVTAGAPFTLHWNWDPGVTSFNIYYKDTPGVTIATGTKVPVYTNGVSLYLPGTTLYFVVTAVTGGAESAVSNEISATQPANAPSLGASGGNGQIVLSWSAMPNAVSYNLYWRNTAGVRPDLGTKIPGITGTTYTHTGLTNGKTYYYILEAVFSAGNSSPSQEISCSLLNGWITKAPMLNIHHAFDVVSVNGIVYVLGGYTANSLVMDNVEAYEPATDIWTAKAPMPTANANFGVEVVNGIIYVIGGCANGCGTITNAVHAYDPATNTWNAKAPMPTARQGLIVSQVNGLIYAIGGIGANNGAAQVIEVYNPAADVWSTITPTGAWHNVVMGHVLSSGNKIFIGDGNSGDVVVFDASTNAIYLVPRFGSLPVAPALYSSGNQIFALASGGAIAQLDQVNKTWIDLVTPPVPRGGMVAAVYNNYFYSIGGYTNAAPGVMTTTVEVYDPYFKFWSAKPSLLTSRLIEKALVINGMIYTFGGYDYVAATYVKTVEAYQ